VLLDECLDWRLSEYLTGAEVRTVQQMGWSSIKNGALLALAQTQFDIFITVDRPLPSQQNLSKYALAVIVLTVRVNKLDRLIPMASKILSALATWKPGVVKIIEED
jgi:hypothetical protein